MATPIVYTPILDKNGTTLYSSACISPGATPNVGTLLPEFTRIRTLELPKVLSNNVKRWDGDGIPPDTFGEDVLKLDVEKIKVVDFYVHSLPINDLTPENAKNGKGTETDPWNNLWYAYSYIYNCFSHYNGLMTLQEPIVPYIHVSGTIERLAYTTSRDMMYTHLGITPPDSANDPWGHSPILDFDEAYINIIQDCTFSSIFDCYALLYARGSITLDMYLPNSDDVYISNGILMYYCNLNITCSVVEGGNASTELYVQPNSSLSLTYRSDLIINTNLDINLARGFGCTYKCVNTEHTYSAVYCAFCEFTGDTRAYHLYGLYDCICSISKHTYVTRISYIYKCTIQGGSSLDFEYIVNSTVLDVRSERLLTGSGVKLRDCVIHSNISVFLDSFIVGMYVSGDILHSTLNITHNYKLTDPFDYIRIVDDCNMHETTINVKLVVEEADTKYSIAFNVISVIYPIVLTQVTVTTDFPTFNKNEVYGVMGCMFHGYEDDIKVVDCTLWEGYCLEGVGAEEDYNKCVNEYGSDKCTRYCDKRGACINL